MARGETRAERRRRRRAGALRRPPYPAPRRRPAPPTPEEELRRALDARPAWVKGIWQTPARRLVLSVFAVLGGCWIVVSTLTDPGILARPYWIAGFVAAPALIALFVAQAIEALLDAVRGSDSLPVFHRIGWWLDRRGLPLVGVYVAVMLGVVVWLG